MKTLFVAIALFATTPAYAQWGATAAYTRYVKADDGANLGDYGSVGVYRSSVVGPLTISPALAVEYAPKTTFWGIMLGTNTDYPLGKRLGLDFMVWVWNDLVETDFSNAAYYIGGGPGISVFLGQWTIQPYLNFYRGWHDGVPTVVAAGVGVSYGF